MIRIPTLLLAATALTLSASACDNSASELIAPVAETETSFEDGLGSWTVQTGPSGGGSATVTQGDASVGSSYLEFSLAQPGDVAWVQQLFVLEPGGEYDVTISADARTFSGTGELVYGALGRSLNAGDLQSQGPMPTGWTRRLMPLPVTADPQGRVWVGVGVGASISGAGTFGLDRVGVVFIRNVN